VMVLGNDVWLPAASELEVPELNITTMPLLAAAHQLGRFCDNQCKEFMLCHQETLKDPRKCLAEGKAVTECGLEFFRQIKRHCALPFERYLNCFEKRSTSYNRPAYCRREQGPFDDCVRQHLGQERPPPGYFSKIRLHDSQRPRPPVPPAPMPQRIEERDLDSVTEPPGTPDPLFAFNSRDTSEEGQRRAREWLRLNKERTTSRNFVPPAHDSSE
ncbi:hypothetical protein BOX15_Mlig013804g3, partial [Macrostomum lignano]